MPVQILRALRRRASKMAYNSVLYNWSLRGNVPDRLVVKPADQWPGDKEAGRYLCQGAFSMDGHVLEVGPKGWEPDDVSDTWIAHMHGFSWLRDLRSLACEKGEGLAARRQARGMIESWMSYYGGWDVRVWRPDITGQRISMWISAFEFFDDECGVSPEDDEDFQDAFFDSLMRQARHLSRCFAQGQAMGAFDECGGVGKFHAIKGLLYAGLAFEGQECWISQALSQLAQEIDAQVAGDGSHASRSPSQLLEVLRILLDVRMALRAGGHPLPEKVQHAIDRMGPALRFFRYTDKKLALFNGAQEGCVDTLDSVLGQAGVRAKTMQSLPCTGFERASLGRSTILMDCGNVPPPGLDVRAHAGPLSFEMMYGRDRLFVNCGSHPCDDGWQDALRATAAHTGLTMDARNACEISGAGRFARKPKNAEVLREENKDAVLLDAIHDGYEALNGFTHRRRLYLSDKGEDLRGEDMLEAQISPAKAVDVAVRFHLHPKVQVSLIRDGQEALLRMPGGTGWRFHIHGGCLSLEDSVYCGDGYQPRKTKQLAVYGQVFDKKAYIKWALQKEG